jgi:hypothetical protein
MHTGVLSSKIEFRDGVKAMGAIKDLESQSFTDRQLDDLFDRMDAKSQHALKLEDFIRTFDPDKQAKTKRRDGSKGELKDGPSKKRILSRSFTEVIMECKDSARGTEQNIVVNVNSKWEDLLQLLQRTFKRPVTFMYEDVSHHQHTVRNAMDLGKCWDALASGGRGNEHTKHLECVIVDYDDAIAKSASDKMAGRGRPSLSERRQKAIRSQGAVGAGDVRDPLESLDFRGRNKWIDDMMRLLGAPLENDPGAMVGKWEILLRECQQLDVNESGIVSVEGFRNALTRTQHRMTLEQVEWYIGDADKDVNGSVAYKAYVETKRQGQASGQAMTAQTQVMRIVKIRMKVMRKWVLNLLSYSSGGRASPGAGA